MLGAVKLTWNGASTCSFGNEFAKSVFLVMPKVHQDILKIANIFLIFGDWPTCHINDGSWNWKKDLILTLLKQRQSFVKAYIIMVLKVICIWVK